MLKPDKAPIERVVHLTNGSQKFLTNCQENFRWIENALPTYWIISTDYHLVEEKVVDEFIQVTKNQSCVVFLHGLWPTHRLCLQHCQGQKHITVTFLWGGDYSVDILGKKYLFGPHTNRLLWKISRRGHFLPYALYVLIWRSYNQVQLFLGRARLARCLGQSDFLIVGFGCFEEEILPRSRSQQLPSFNPYYQYIRDSGTSLYDGLKASFDAGMKDPISVLVGNSGFPLLNHIDVIDLVRRINPNVRFRFNILVSYGDKTYVESLQKHFGTDHDITFITTFFTIEAYRKLIASHDILAMGSMRQQGSGFIREALTHRKPLYLFPESLAYKHLKSQGIEVFSLRKGLEKVDNVVLESNISIFKKSQDRLRSEFKVAIQNILGRSDSD